MPKKVDFIKEYSYLVGKKINKWTVLDIVIKESGDRNRPYAVCRCDCGNTKPVLIKNLTNNLSKDCGCGRKSMLKETRTKNLIGQKFGKLTVIDMLEERNKNGRIIYKCKCDCGTEINVLGNSLTTYHTLSCGCLVSYWNMYIRQFLKENQIAFKTEYTVYIGDNYYRYDFYLPQYNLFIEYDGQQHYEPVRFHGNNIAKNKRDFEVIQEHDKIKNQYCKDNNINLLRIPHWETKNIETIINNCLQRLNEKGFVENASTRYATV